MQESHHQLLWQSQWQTFKLQETKESYRISQETKSVPYGQENVVLYTEIKIHTDANSYMYQIKTAQFSGLLHCLPSAPPSEMHYHYSNAAHICSSSDMMIHKQYIHN